MEKYEVDNNKYNNNKCKISAPNWNDNFIFPNGSNSISGIQDYFEYIVKKHETITDNPPVQIYTYKIKNYTGKVERKIVFKIKTDHKLELSPETMKISGSKKKDADQNKDGEHVGKLESVKDVLVNCNLELSTSIHSIIYFCTK